MLKDIRVIQWSCINEKAYFLKRATTLTSATHLLWLDIGSFRKAEIAPLINSELFPYFGDNYREGKILITRQGALGKPITKFDNRFIFQVYLGGMFGGDREAITSLCQHHTEILREMVSARCFTGKDQAVYAFISWKYPELFQIVDANAGHAGHAVKTGYDPWFYLHLYLCRN